MINLEIKCPFSRVIEPGKVKDIYWKQMQLQMAVLDLELTHFFEVTLHEYPTERDFWMDFNYDGFENPEKGIVIEIVDHEVTNLANLPKTCYEYSPIPLCTDEAALRRWYKKAILDIVQSKNKIYIRTHFWIAKVVSCVNVFRDREWFSAQIPKFCSFWEEVKYYRENGGLEEVDRDIERYKPKKREKSSTKSDLLKDRIISIEFDENEGLIPDDYLLESSEDQSIKKSKTKMTFTPKNTINCIDTSNEEDSLTHPTNTKITQNLLDSLSQSGTSSQEPSENEIQILSDP